MPTLEDLSDEELAAELEQRGSVSALAEVLGVPRTSLRRALERRELVSKAVPRPSPRLTRDALHHALEPPNNCAVKRFRESLDDESRAVFDEALSYDRRDLSAGKLREVLINVGFSDVDVPGADAINDHRAGRRPCRCKG